VTRQTILDIHTCCPKEELSIQIGDINSIHVNHVNVAETAQCEVLQNFATKPTGTDDQHLCFCVNVINCLLQCNVVILLCRSFESRLGEVIVCLKGSRCSFWELLGCRLQSSMHGKHEYYHVLVPVQRCPSEERRSHCQNLKVESVDYGAHSPFQLEMKTTSQRRAQQWQP
jgi:hypothetical protein